MNSNAKPLTATREIAQKAVQAKQKNDNVLMNNVKRTHTVTCSMCNWFLVIAPATTCSYCLEMLEKQTQAVELDESLNQPKEIESREEFLREATRLRGNRQFMIAGVVVMVLAGLGWWLFWLLQM